MEKQHFIRDGVDQHRDEINYMILHIDHNYILGIRLYINDVHLDSLFKRFAYVFFLDIWNFQAY